LNFDLFSAGSRGADEPPKERQLPLYTIGPAGASFLEPVVQMEYKNWVRISDVVIDVVERWTEYFVITDGI
jgi:hypothetical protein